MLNIAQIYVALFIQVEQPPGRCDQQINTTSKRFDLRRLPHATENDGGIQG